MKCPQLSKPEATAQGTKTPSVTEWKKKPWEKPDSVGGAVPLWSDEPAVCSNCSKVRLCKGLIWFPRSCPKQAVICSALGRLCWSLWR